MSWLLDSDVLSQPAKKAGDTRVITWLEKHQHECYTSSIVIAQLALWVRTKRGKQRMALPQSFFIGRDGKIIKQTYGVRGKDEFEKHIREALATPALPAT